MSFFTIAIIVYVILMIVLEFVQGGKRRKTPTPLLKEYVPEEIVEEVQKKWTEKEEEGEEMKEKEIKKEEVKPVEKEKIEKTPEIIPKITPKLAKEVVSEAKEKIEEKRKIYRESQGKILLKKLKDNDLLKLIIFKEILEPHPLTKRFLFRRRI